MEGTNSLFIKATELYPHKDIRKVLWHSLKFVKANFQPSELRGLSLLHLPGVWSRSGLNASVGILLPMAQSKSSWESWVRLQAVVQLPEVISKLQLPVVFVYWPKETKILMVCCRSVCHTWYYTTFAMI